jgi:hypothetical protein
MARARRRLVEFELLERKVLLAATLLLAVATVVVAFAGGDTIHIALAAAGSAVGGSALVARSRSRREPG